MERLISNYRAHVFTRIAGQGMSILVAVLLLAGLCTSIIGEASAPNGSTTRTHQKATLQITSDVPFEDLMALSMSRMHHEMQAVEPGQAPRDLFLKMMIPHHQGAVDMAKGILLHTEDPRMKNLAQSIITEQTYEIELMRLMLAENQVPGDLHDELEKGQ